MPTFKYSGDLKETRSYEFHNNEIFFHPKEVDRKVQEIYDEAVKHFEEAGITVLDYQKVFIDTQRKRPEEYDLYQQSEYYDLLGQGRSKVYHIFRIKEADSSLEN